MFHIHVYVVVLIFALVAIFKPVKCLFPFVSDYGIQTTQYIHLYLLLYSSYNLFFSSISYTHDGLYKHVLTAVLTLKAIKGNNNVTFSSVLNKCTGIDAFLANN